MALKFKLARQGRKNRPHYAIVIGEARGRRDGKFVAKVGTYDPMLKDGVKVQISDPECIKKYLACGTQPTERVEKLFKIAGVLS